MFKQYIKHKHPPAVFISPNGPGAGWNTGVAWTQIQYRYAMSVATILADAAATPPSPKWPKNVSSGTLNLAQPNTTQCTIHKCSGWRYTEHSRPVHGATTTKNIRSPSVIRRVVGTSSVDDDVDPKRRRRRDSTLDDRVFQPGMMARCREGSGRLAHVNETGFAPVLLGNEGHGGVVLRDVALSWLRTSVAALNTDCSQPCSNPESTELQ